MTISGVYIVKNEEKNLRRSVESLRDVCTEIIVVDTGSEDGTVALAEELGARVLHFKWRNDFAAARNYAISHAKGEMIIFLDADEWFAKSLGPEAVEYLADQLGQGNTSFFVPHRDNHNGRLGGVRYVMRLFKNFCGIRYAGAIHEQPTAEARQTVSLPEELFAVHHSGYAPEKIQGKLERNLEVLEREIRQEKDPRKRMNLYFYLARESNTSGDADRALSYLERFFRGERRDPAYRKSGSLVFVVAAHHLRIQVALRAYPRRYSLADCRGFVDAFLRDFPTHPVSKYMEAQLEYTVVGDIVKAYACLLEAEALEARYSDKEYPGDITTFGSVEMLHFFCKGEIERLMGHREKAFGSYSKALPLGNANALLPLLQLVQGLPEGDVIAFFDHILPNQEEGALTQLLTQLLYFPTFKGVFQYYAIRLVKTSGSHSDLSAVASLFEEPRDLSHAAQVACRMLETDNYAANILMLAAALHCGRVEDFEPYRDRFEVGRLVDAGCAGQPLEDITLAEFYTLSLASVILFFLDDADVKARLLAMLAKEPFLRLRLVSDYCLKAGRPGPVLEQAEGIEIDALETRDEKLSGHAFLMNACAQAGVYEAAVDHAKACLTLAPDAVLIRRNLYELKALAPALAQKIDEVLLMDDMASLPNSPLH